MPYTHTAQLIFQQKRSTSVGGQILLINVAVFDGLGIMFVDLYVTLIWIYFFRHSVPQLDLIGGGEAKERD